MLCSQLCQAYTPDPGLDTGGDVAKKEDKFPKIVEKP
jgi:hypothetical protein